VIPGWQHWARSEQGAKARLAQVPLRGVQLLAMAQQAQARLAVARQLAPVRD